MQLKSLKNDPSPICAVVISAAGSQFPAFSSKCISFILLCVFSSMKSNAIIQQVTDGASPEQVVCDY